MNRYSSAGFKYYLRQCKGFLSFLPFLLFINPFVATAGRATKNPPRPSHQQARLLPVVNAGNDTTIILPVNTVTLSGSVSDGSGSISMFNWTKISGPGTVVFYQPDAATTNVTNLEAGVYVFRLTVSDNEGGTAWDDVQVTVKALIANAGPDTLIYKNQTRIDSALLNGSGSAGNTFHWEFVSGPTVPVIQSPDAVTTWATGFSEGFYQFKLTVDAVVSDTVTVYMRDWQKKGIAPCRTGYDTTAKRGGLKIILEPNYKGTYLKKDGTTGTWNQWNFITNVQGYVQSTKKVTLSGGDTLLMEGADSTVLVELGGFGGSPGCPVYVMPRTKPIRIRGTSSFFRIATRDSNVVQYVVVDGTVLRNAGYPYGFLMDNSNLAYASNGPFTGGWLANFTLKGLHSTKTNALKIKLDPTKYLFCRYDKFVQKNILLTDNWIDSSSVEGMYIGSTATDGGQLSNSYGPPPRMDSVEISNNIVTNCAWDGIQLANAKNGCIIKDNLVFKAGTANMPSQRAGILMGGNTTGEVSNNIIINSKGNGIQVFGYGDVNVYNNIIDSINGGKGDQDGMYQTFIVFTSEPSVAPLRMYNFNNLIGRVERNTIRVANNNGKMLPGRTHHNPFIHPTATVANSLIVTNAKDILDNNSIVASFPYKLNTITTKDAAINICMTQGDTTQTFTSVKETVDWLFKRFNGVSAYNNPPVVSAGRDTIITLPADSLLLSGSASDMDGDIKTYQWRKISGPAGELFETSSAARTFVRSLSQGTYLFEFVATDNGNSTGRDTLTVTVNTPPIANAGGDKMITLPLNKVMLYGSGTDADGSIRSVNWTVLSGPSSYRFQDAHVLTTSIDSLEKGIYTIELQVFDDRNASASDTLIVTVNIPPTVLAGADQTITLPLNSVLLQGSAQDADGSITAVKWTKLSGPVSFRFQNAATVNTTVDSLIAGTYLFMLAGTDDRGASMTDTVIVTVNTSMNKPPVANAGVDKQITLPTNSITLTGSGTDTDGSVVSFNWAKISGPAQGTITNATAATTTVTSLAAGTYIFRLTVTDNNGAAATDDVVITVLNAPVTTSTKYINVNIYGSSNAYSNSSWNNWSIRTKSTSNATSALFKYSDGKSSTINAVLSYSSNIADNGSSYGSGMAPAQVLRYTSYYSGNRTLTIKGLATTRKYSIDLYASRNVSGSSTIFTINGVSKTIAIYKNLSVKATFTNLSPNANGQIIVNIAKSGSFNCLNGFTITETSTTTNAITSAHAFQLSEEKAYLAGERFEMYPNPVADKVLLKLTTRHKGTVEVEIISATGSILKKQQFETIKQQSEHALEVGDLAPGIYFMAIRLGSWCISRSFIKL